DDGNAVGGTLEIPMPGAGGSKPAWIVDGQQRALALSKSRRKAFPVPVNAFLAENVELQRDQFLRINNTKPLPRRLLTELLPEVSTQLPARLAARRVPAALCDLLNTHEASPFRGMIKRSSAPVGERRKAVVTDTSIVKMIEESMFQHSGCLFPCRRV